MHSKPSPWPMGQAVSLSGQRSEEYVMFSILSLSSSSKSWERRRRAIPEALMGSQVPAADWLLRLAQLWLGKCQDLLQQIQHYRHRRRSQRPCYIPGSSWRRRRDTQPQAGSRSVAASRSAPHLTSERHQGTYADDLDAETDSEEGSNNGRSLEADHGVRGALCEGRMRVSVALAAAGTKCGHISW
mgnify:FL=1